MERERQEQLELERREQERKTYFPILGIVFVDAEALEAMESIIVSQFLETK